ncbi:hypothetical protein [Streptomyces cylindrosporus]|uniref:Uncharacterized protein n=1 Tax=Streptomyces cylindrosporus TaxID=2927583 RepID=A0ABS9Y8J9_9ACTN|nr:hypothetical protein [Streptomyces cylindrosporus]MCI3273547.1 hypothetical protein [Streptomyces cylindrosporus]
MDRRRPRRIPCLRQTADRLALARGTVEFDLGQHYAWTAYSSGEWRLVHRSIVGEPQRFIGHLDDNDGRIVVDDPQFRFAGPELEHWFRAYHAARQGGDAVTTAGPRRRYRTALTPVSARCCAGTGR